MSEGKRRNWRQTSASQHNAFTRCQRYWYFGWIDRLERPSGVGARRGKGIHKESEHFLLTGRIRESSYDEEGNPTKPGLGESYAPYVEALRPHLPPPQDPDLIIEQRIWLPTIEGVWWLGFIDIGYSGTALVKVHDIKSLSDFRYRKTPEELAHDIQLNSYARWVFEDVGHRGELELGHLYVKTAPKVPKKPRVKPVSTIVTRDHVAGVWDEAMPVVSTMKKIAAECDSAHDLPPTVSACGMFGGCPFRSNCGITSRDFFQGFGKKKEKKMGTWLDKVRAKKGKEEKKDEAPSIVPDDAPSRETSDEEAAKIRAEVEEKARKREEKKAKAAQAAAGKPNYSKMKKAELVALLEAGGDGAHDVDQDQRVEHLTGELEGAMKKIAELQAAAKGGSKGFVLYIDCVLSKGRDVPTTFEDWYAEISARMDAAAEDEGGFWSLGFAEQKGLLVATVTEEIRENGLPPAMSVMSGSLGARDTIGLLIPHATNVVRGR